MYREEERKRTEGLPGTYKRGQNVQRVSVDRRTKAYQGKKKKIIKRNEGEKATEFGEYGNNRLGLSRVMQLEERDRNTSMVLQNAIPND